MKQKVVLWLEDYQVEAMKEIATKEFRTLSSAATALFEIALIARANARPQTVTQTAPFTEPDTTARAAIDDFRQQLVQMMVRLERISDAYL
jgi:hypothetical protein